MDSGNLRRHLVALAAAYAVALQALLLAFVPAATSGLTAEFGILCTHDGEGSGGPPSHDLPCAALCAALGHGIAGPVPAGIAAVLEAFAFVAVGAPVMEWLAPHRVLSGLPVTRGPPLG